MTRFCLCFLLFWGMMAGIARGQDSVRIFTYADYADLILKHHPVVRQAQLLPADARAELMQARGMFDPKLSSDFSRKEYKDNEYYNNWENTLKIPTWTGIDLKAGFDRNTGKYVNPQYQTPDAGLVYAGLSVPLAQGLIIDARRATVRQALLLQDMAEADRRKAVNKVMYDAAKTYWDWYFSFQQFRYTQEGLQLAETRYRAVKERVDIGDLAAIDSVQAKITVQERQAAFQAALVDWQNARLGLSNNLWNEQGNPVELPENAIPGGITLPEPTDEQLQALLVRAEDQHPELLKFGYKLKQLEIERKLRQNQLLPTLNVNYNFIREPVAIGKTYDAGWWLTNNYKVGAEFSFPLFLRKERGKLQQVRIKQNMTQLDQQQTRRDIGTTVRQVFNEARALQQQGEFQRQATENQALLVRAEQQKFDIGESTLFLVNTQESKLIEMRIKTESLRAKFAKAWANSLYAAGGTTP
jgi:outer membrane protein